MVANWLSECMQRAKPLLGHENQYLRTCGFGSKVIRFAASAIIALEVFIFISAYLLHFSSDNSHLIRIIVLSDKFLAMCCHVAGLYRIHLPSSSL